ncbi:agmatine deiminase family protein, partial [bacterium]|nr:agmatine deiminase family protein [bacterium]
MKQNAMKQNKNTPAALGYRHPAEWEPHEATWLTWPHTRSDWPGKFQVIPWVFGEIVRKLAPGETINLIVDSPQRKAAAQRVLQKNGADLSAVNFHQIKTDRGWNRDAGPIFIKRDSKREPLAVINFQFNAWAKYPEWKLDNQVPAKAARKLKLPYIDVKANGKPV